MSDPLTIRHTLSGDFLGERHDDFPGSSGSSMSSFKEDQFDGSAFREANSFPTTVWWGYVLLGITWLTFVLGLGGVCGVWSWSLRAIRFRTRYVGLYFHS
jgi:hypothetical protein